MGVSYFSTNRSVDTSRSVCLFACLSYKLGNLVWNRYCLVSAVKGGPSNEVIKMGYCLTIESWTFDIRWEFFLRIFPGILLGDTYWSTA